jgi:hypothetical protein
MRTGLDMLAVLVDVGAAGLGQQDIVAEVVHLHLLKVEHLRGTIRVSNSKQQKPLPQILHWCLPCSAAPTTLFFTHFN